MRKLHYTLTTILVTASLIAILGGAAAGLYYYITQVPEAPATAFQGKIPEISALLTASQDGVVYGVSTGRCAMSSVQLEPFNITLRLPEGSSWVLANKTALAVQGMVLSLPPAPSPGNTTSPPASGGVKAFFSSSTSSTYIMPLMRLASVTTEKELGATVHLITLSVPSIQQDFSAAGTFSIMRKTVGTESAEYARSVRMGGTAVLFVDGEQVAALQVQAGEKVKVVVVYDRIQLIKTNAG